MIKKIDCDDWLLIAAIVGVIIIVLTGYVSAAENTFPDSMIGMWKIDSDDSYVRSNEDEADVVIKKDSWGFEDGGCFIQHVEKSSANSIVVQAKCTAPDDPDKTERFVTYDFELWSNGKLIVSEVGS